MAKIQHLVCSGLFGASFGVNSCEIPLCKACLHGKQHRTSISSTSTWPLVALHLSPGDESIAPGPVPVLWGSPFTEKHFAGTLFVDHVRCYLHFTSHHSTDSLKAINAKHSFEHDASLHNHLIWCYHTDNGVFSSKDFRQSCLHQHQHIRFCGVNAHHQNNFGLLPSRGYSQLHTYCPRSFSWGNLHRPEGLQQICPIFILSVVLFLSLILPCSKVTRFLVGNLILVLVST